MIKKKLLTVTTAAIMTAMMAVSFTGCQNGQAAGTESTTKTASTATPEDKNADKDEGADKTETESNPLNTNKSPEYALSTRTLTSEDKTVKGSVPCFDSKEDAYDNTSGNYTDTTAEQRRDSILYNVTVIATKLDDKQTEEYLGKRADEAVKQFKDAGEYDTVEKGKVVKGKDSKSAALCVVATKNGAADYAAYVVSPVENGFIAADISWSEYPEADITNIETERTAKALESLFKAYGLSTKDVLPKVEAKTEIEDAKFDYDGTEYTVKVPKGAKMVNTPTGAETGYDGVQMKFFVLPADSRDIESVLNTVCDDIVMDYMEQEDLKESDCKRGEAVKSGDKRRYEDISFKVDEDTISLRCVVDDKDKAYLVSVISNDDIKTVSETTAKTMKALVEQYS